MTSWDLLLPTIPHRHEQLCGLLAGLDTQLSRQMPHVRVLLYRDNTEHTIARKRQRLLEAARAQWVSFIDDDDAVSPRYVPAIMTALQDDPDYVGFRVRYLVDGTDQNMLIEHSLRYKTWYSDSAGLFRDISHLNPVRRELALLGRFGGGFSEDSRWAAMLRETGRVRTEAWIPEALYWYRFSSTANSRDADYYPLPPDEIKPLPAYPWLTVLPGPGRNC